MKSETDLQKAIQMAKAEIYDGARYIGTWNGFDVFEPTFNDNEPRFIGFPQFIIAKDGVCRWTASDDESRAVMRAFASSVDE